MESLLDTVKEVYRDSRHFALQVRSRFANPLRRLRLDLSATTEMAVITRALRRDGIAIVPGFAQGERLIRMQASFNRMIDSIRAGPPSPEIQHPPPATTLYREQVHDEVIGTTHSYDPFKFEPEFLATAVHDLTVGAVAGYYASTEFMLHYASAIRYHPMPPKDFLSWQWHHDECGKRVTAILLLTDVTAQDQYMSYLKGSHRPIHSRARFVNSRLTQDEVDRVYGDCPRIDCICPAGSLLVFDTNGIHRGNRSLGAHRDSLVFCYGYHAGHLVYPFRVPKAALAQLTEGQRTFLHRNPRIEPI